MSDKAGGSSMRPDDHRRKWDSVEYEKNAKARQDLEDAINRDRSKDKKADPIERERLQVGLHNVVITCDHLYTRTATIVC